MKRVLLSPWLILGLLVLGWVPVYVADWVRNARPDLDAAYTPQAFAMGWLGVCFFCSAGAITLAVFHGARIVVGLVRKYLDSRAHPLG